MMNTVGMVLLLGIALGMSPAIAQDLADPVVARSLAGQEMIFARRYDDAMRIFAELKRDFPESPAGFFGTMAVYEIRMLEREDFHLEREFLAEAKAGMEQVNATLRRYRPAAWDLFLAGSVLGLEGFFKARKGAWWGAYTAGTKSRQIFRRVKEMDPAFVDADFGLGMYIYWRSVFSHELSFLKIFPDRRQEGVAIVERVAREGRFARELARANLGIMHLEDKRFGDAERVFADFVARYPQNVILRTMLGRSLLGLARYDDAASQFREILSIDPSLKKPHYFLGVALVLRNDPSRFAEAEGELKGFLAKEAGGKYWPAYAHYWLGRLAEARGQQAAARQEYEAALKLNPKVQDAARRARGMGGGV